MPSRRPCRPVPSIMNIPQCHGRRERIRRSPSARRRVTMRIRAMARSAVASVSTPGVFVTSTPRVGTRRHVDVVEADRNVGDDLQPRSCGEEAGVDDVGEERHRGVGRRQPLVADLGRDRLVAIPGPDLAGLTQQRQADLGDAAQHDDLRRLRRRHHPPPNRGSGAIGWTRPSRSRAAASRQAPGRRQARRVPGLRPVADHAVASRSGPTACRRCPT